MYMRPAPNPQRLQGNSIPTISQSTAGIMFSNKGQLPPTDIIDGQVMMAINRPDNNAMNILKDGQGISLNQLKQSLGCVDSNDLKWNAPGIFFGADVPKAYVPVVGGQRGSRFGLGSFSIYPTNTPLLAQADTFFPQYPAPVRLQG